MNRGPAMNRPTGAYGCAGHRKDGELCGRPAIAGTDLCRVHPGKPLAQHKAEGQVRRELSKWGLGDSTVDAGEVLLRLVSQSSLRVELYSGLLERAYVAAESLAGVAELENPYSSSEDSGLSAGELVEAVPHKPNTVDRERALADVGRIFSTGGVGALVGMKYGVDKEGRVYGVEEGIRGLVQLEAQERTMCATFASKAVAAGLAERQVRLAEAQGALIGLGLRWLVDSTADRLALEPGKVEVLNDLVAEMLGHLRAGTVPAALERNLA